MTEPMVSVVMGVHNGASRLDGAVGSILSQQGVDFEFIVVNDGSTDASGDILAEYAARDRRVRVFEQENAGLTMALIRGCAQARGKYIARQDADDLSLPGRLAAQAGLLDSDDRLAFVSSWAYIRGPNRELLAEHQRPAEPVSATRLLTDHRVGPPAHGSVMFRRDAYDRAGRYRKEFYYSQDNDLWLRFAETGLLGYCQEFLYVYQVTNSQIGVATRPEQHELGRLARACRAARLAGESETPLLEQASRIRPPLNREKRRGRRDAWYLIGSCLRRRRDPRARKYYWEELARRPWALRAWCGLLVSYLTGRRKACRNVTAQGLVPLGEACQDGAS